ncbi:hypothetical protein [Desulfotomaculum sp. 1211_IL3151]|uniref:hypothetical protein n=1 Tax=Desulfotomaculum sp. 1211_IL3151 TaxID=3084055 RepID=UPI002FDA2DB2
MEGMGYNVTLLAQLFNFLVLSLLFVVLVVVIVKVVRRSGGANPEHSRLDKMEQDIQRIKINIRELAKKLDKKQ